MIWHERSAATKAALKLPGIRSHPPHSMCLTSHIVMNLFRSRCHNVLAKRPAFMSKCSARAENARNACYFVA